MSTPSHTGGGQRTAAPNATYGSTTVTTTPAGPTLPFNLRSGTLRLRATSQSEAELQPDTSTRRRIQWAEDVIDNEGMGKKSSKVCCIYHKPRDAGESSEDDSSSSSSSDSDSGADNSRAQPAKGRHRSDRRRDRHQHDHDGGPCEHDHADSSSKSNGKQKERRRSPNAYERVPKKRQPKPPT